MAAKQTYTERLAANQKRVQSLKDHDTIIARARLLIFFCAAGIAAMIFSGSAISPLWCVPLAGAFLALIIIHGIIVQKRTHAEALILYYTHGLRRLDHTWPGTGKPGTAFLPEDHPYAADLDLFGTGSMFERLCLAQTQAGESTLAKWLLEPAPIDDVHARNQAVQELTPAIDLRETLGQLNHIIRTQVHPDLLIHWAEAAPAFSPPALRWIKIATWGATLGCLVAAGLWVMTPFGAAPFLAVVLVELALYYAFRRPLLDVAAKIGKAESELSVIRQVVRCLEKETFQSPRLRRLQHQLVKDDTSAAIVIKQLIACLSWYHAQHNQLFAPLAFFLMWRLHFSLAIETWRLKNGPAVRRWLSAIGEIEALLDFSAYAFERPQDTFARIEAGNARYKGKNIRHPLIPECVPNTIDLSADAEHLLIVSGSNMSGKTTWLRSLGLNAVLAYAGAPVCASALHLSPMNIGATIAVHDSIQKGRSKFYSEILRLKRFWEKAQGEPPLFFLLDEIFHGTNSKDRYAGAKAFLNQLIDAGAIGLVTTHDLALTDIAEECRPLARNVHFADSIQDTQLVFDYKMHAGVVTRSNALYLMRSLGLLKTAL